MIRTWNHWHELSTEDVLAEFLSMPVSVPLVHFLCMVGSRCPSYGVGNPGIGVPSASHLLLGDCADHSWSLGTLKSGAERPESPWQVLEA